MNLNQNLVKLYSKYYDYNEDRESLENFKIILEDCLEAVKQHLMLSFNFEISEFGSINFNTIINQNESILFYIKIYDNQIYENTYKIGNSKNKKTKIITTESIKLLCALYLENYFGEVNTVNITRNSLFVNSSNLIGFNSSIFIFASNNFNDIMLDSSEKKLITFNNENLNNVIFKKIIDTDYNYSRITNIIKNLANKSNMLQMPLLIETLIYNVPNKYFNGNIYEQLIKIINYIRFGNLTKFESIVNKNLELKSDLFYSSSIYNIFKAFDDFIKVLI